MRAFRLPKRRAATLHLRLGVAFALFVLAWAALVAVAAPPARQTATQSRPADNAQLNFNEVGPKRLFATATPSPTPIPTAAGFPTSPHQLAPSR